MDEKMVWGLGASEDEAKLAWREGERADSDDERPEAVAVAKVEAAVMEALRDRCADWGDDKIESSDTPERSTYGAT